MRMFVIGKVVDKNGIGIPNAAVWISNERGGRKENQPRVRADESGNFKIVSAVPMPSPLGVGLSRIPTGTHITAQSAFMVGSKPSTEKIDFSKPNSEPIEITLFDKTQQLAEIPVKADSKKTECEKSGGLWDAENNTCKIPEVKVDPVEETPEKKKLTKLQKQLVIGTVVVLGTLTIAALVTKLTKD